MDNKNKIKLVNFAKSNLSVFLILIFTLLIQYSVLGTEDPVKTFIPDPQIQAQIKRIISAADLENKAKADEEWWSQVAKLKDMLSKDIKKFIPECIYYRANLEAKKSEMDTRTFEKSLAGSLVLVNIIYYNISSWEELNKFDESETLPEPVISRREYFDAIVPYLGTKDPYWKEELKEFFSFPYDKEKNEYDLSEEESFIKEKKENLPLGLIKYMFKEAPKESALTLTRIYIPEDKAKEIEAKIKETDEIVNKALHAPLGEPAIKLTEEATKVLMGLLQIPLRERWIIHLYIAEIVKQHQEFRHPYILPSLINKNQHPLVRETMREMLEKLLQEVK